MVDLAETMVLSNFPAVISAATVSNWDRYKSLIDLPLSMKTSLFKPWHSLAFLAIWNQGTLMEPFEPLMMTF